MKEKLALVKGDEGIVAYKDQIKIENWSEILPDADMLLIDRKKRFARAIISCKTSLRERLTETAFWKREQEKSDRTINVRVIFITTDKDNELGIEQIDTFSYT